MEEVDLEGLIFIFQKTFFYLIDLNYSMIVSLCNVFMYIVDFLSHLAEIIECTLLFVYQLVSLLILLLNLVISSLPKIFNDFLMFLKSDSKLDAISRLLRQIGIFNNLKINNNIAKFYLTSIVIFFLVIYYFKMKIKKLKKSNDQLQASSLVYACVICKEANSDILLLPCKHLCSCLACYNLMKENNLRSLLSNYCPLCRCQIENDFKIFA